MQLLKCIFPVLVYPFIFLVNLSFESGVVPVYILNWKQHILFLKSKLKKIIWITNIISKFINKKALLHIYNSIFLPHIKYCNIFWGNTYKSNVSCIYILQKRMIRIICKKHFLHHTNGLFIDNSLLKINEITYISTCEFMFKIFNDLHPVITNAFFSVTSSSHNTRSINNFSIINFKKELCRRTLIYIGPITWNKLDNILKIFQIINYLGNVCIQICYLLTQYTYNLNLIFLILYLLSCILSNIVLYTKIHILFLF